MPLQCYKFGDFELDPARFELRRNGHALKLERIPLELLILLAEKGGNVVTRQEISEKLWGKDVFVDTEHGINTAVRKVRSALQEDADQPHFVQTVPGKGYRFVAELKGLNQKGKTPGILPEAADAESAPSEAAPGRRRSWRLVAMVALVLLLLAGASLILNLGGWRERIFAGSQLKPIRSIAVLPLANLSGDPAQDYFADGITDELITALARNRSLRVVSRTSTMQYKGVSKPIREVAQALGVDGILEGSVNRSGNRVHVNLQLIHAPTDTHVWAEGYDRDLDGAFSLPGEVAQTIAREANAETVQPGTRRDVNPAAHDAYLQGRYLWVAGNNVESKKLFEKAIQLQPDYAAAWSGISDSVLAGGLDRARWKESTDQAEAAARKAVALDDSLAEGHHALAAVYFFARWNWERADEESRRSLELDPNFSEAHHLRSYILFAMNRLPEALQEQEQATAIDPFLRPWALGRAYYRLRRYDDAIAEFRMRAQAGPSAASWVHDFLSRVYGFKGMDKESVQELIEDTRLNRGEKAAADIQRAYDSGGRRAVLQLQLNDLQKPSRKESVSPFYLAQAYAALGMKDETLKQLEDAYREHATDLVFLQAEPVFDFLHSSARYRALVKNVGLVPAY